jgi:hypothetical protein
MACSSACSLAEHYGDKAFAAERLRAALFAREMAVPLAILSK